ncbi:unnamed protein product [Sphagnum troendelagicum]|uniref:Uncharacterized protein n=1 Tax=Sphagnum troendelagicum TaxID=128251 RepID=A0ABP0UZ83_9BRYO
MKVEENCKRERVKWKRRRGEWSGCVTDCLLDAYEDKWKSLDCGNSRRRHWEEVARHVPAQRGGGGRGDHGSKTPFSVQQQSRPDEDVGRALSAVKLDLWFLKVRIQNSLDFFAYKISSNFSLQSFANSILKLEEAKLEMHCDSERLLVEREARPLDLQLKHTEMLLDTQLEITKLLTTQTWK